MKDLIEVNKNTSWKYRVVIERDSFTVEHFKLKADAEARFRKVIFEDTVINASCDKGTMQYKRFERAKQPGAFYKTHLQ